MPCYDRNGQMPKAPPHWTTIDRFHEDCMAAIAKNPAAFRLTPEERATSLAKAEADIARCTKILQARGVGLEGKAITQ